MKTLVLPQKGVHSGNLILVNARLAVEETAQERPLVPVKAGPVLLHQEAARQLSALMEKLDGWQSITPVSGWRSMREQQDIYAQSLRDSGEEFTQKFVAIPGHSEHQTGLAIDLGLTKDHIDFIRPDFPSSGVCLEFRRWAAAFGFVERYPEGKESITGIGYEPWHFRYVGTPHAAIMQKLRLTLEEYHAFLKGYPRGERCLNYEAGETCVAVSYVAATESTCIELDDSFPYMVSGDNEEGFVVAEWRGQSWI